MTPPADAPIVVPTPITTTTPAPPPSPPPAPPPPASPPPAPERAKPDGWDTVPTAAAQIGAGVGGCCVGACVSLPCAFIPFVGGILSNVVTGVVIGSVETVVGDALGKTRSPVIWPVLASSAILVASGLVNMGVTAAFGVTTFDPNNPTAILSSPAVPITLAVGLGGTLLALIVPAAAYHLTSVDKEEGDKGGLSMPGIFSPADPNGARAKREAAPPPPPDPPPSPPADGAVGF